MMKTKAIISLMFVVFCCKLATAQPTKGSETFSPATVVSLGNCEENTSQLGIISQYTDTSELIIVISHLGKSEKKEIGERRLHNALTFFNKGAGDEFNRSSVFIVTAEGGRVEGKGYLDFFVKGKLTLRIFLAKNRDLALRNCVKEPEEKPCSSDLEKLLYPCKSK